MPVLTGSVSRFHSGRSKCGATNRSWSAPPGTTSSQLSDGLVNTDCVSRSICIPCPDLRMVSLLCSNLCRRRDAAYLDPPLATTKSTPSFTDSSSPTGAMQGTTIPADQEIRMCSTVLWVLQTPKGLSITSVPLESSSLRVNIPTSLASSAL